MGSGGLPGAIWVIVALGLFWLAVAAAIAFVAARRLKLAEDVLAIARSNAALLELAPSRPLVVRPDGRVEADAQLLRDLGVAKQPSRLDDLDGAIVAEDFEGLKADIEAARV